MLQLLGPGEALETLEILRLAEGPFTFRVGSRTVQVGSEDSSNEKSLRVIVGVTGSDYTLIWWLCLN